MRPAWLGCVRSAFVALLGQQLFILFLNTSLNRLGFAMLTVGTDIVHWLYFDYICSL